MGPLRYLMAWFILARLKSLTHRDRQWTALIASPAATQWSPARTCLAPARRECSAPNCLNYQVFTYFVPGGGCFGSLRVATLSHDVTIVGRSLYYVGGIIARMNISSNHLDISLSVTRRRCHLIGVRNIGAHPGGSWSWQGKEAVRPGRSSGSSSGGENLPARHPVVAKDLVGCCYQGYRQIDSVEPGMLLTENR